MSWFRVDDTLHAHRKARRAGHEALGLWVVCGSYASSQVATGDGFLASDEVESIAASIGCRRWEALAQKLVDVGLWEAADGGFFFHDWAHYREGGDAELERRRENDRKRKRGAYVPKSLRGTSAEISAEKSGEPPPSSAESNGDVSAKSPHPPVPSRPVRQIPPTPQGAGDSEDEIPEGAVDICWLRSLRLAKAPGYVVPRGGLQSTVVQAIAEDWDAAKSRRDWASYASAMARDVAEWVGETVAAGRVGFTGGWKWSAFAGWRAERDSKQSSAAPRSPATAVWRPTPTQDAVPPPEGFLDGIGKPSGPIRRVLS